MILSLLRKGFVLCLCISFAYSFCYGGEARPLIDKGWQAFVKDRESEAFELYQRALDIATKENDTADKALVLLNLGIYYYGSSHSKGLEYCLAAMDEYEKMEQASPAIASEGRARCLQLISTIYSRQGNFRETISLSTKALEGFAKVVDTNGYVGLIYTSLANSYKHLGISDSSEYFYRLALDEHLKKNNLVYLPSAYCMVADIELEKGNTALSKEHYERALFLSDSTGNLQTEVLAEIGLGKWYMKVRKDYLKAEQLYNDAQQKAFKMRDNGFHLLSLNALLELRKEQGRYKDALNLQDEVMEIKDTINSMSKRKIVESLQMQFNVSEKERQLEIANNEKRITVLKNSLLWGVLIVVSLFLIIIIIFYRQRQKRNQDLLNKKEELLQVKEELVITTEEKKLLLEQQMKNELEFRESQLSALTLQMAQKNELLQELKESLEDSDKLALERSSIAKIFNKGLSQDKEWSDFDKYFESVNKNFYKRLKEEYPDITPNDMKICALIKLNLSMKEMAGVLNISPQSVKTARYRLRKKLQLNTEDNLTDFIINL